MVPCYRFLLFDYPIILTDTVTRLNDVVTKENEADYIKSLCKKVNSKHKEQGGNE